MHITEMSEDNRYSSLALNSFEQGLKACLSGGGGSQVGEVTRLGLVTACPYDLSYGHPSYHENVIKLK